jgi:hypothetical protein
MLKRVIMSSNMEFVRWKGLRKSYRDKVFRKKESGLNRNRAALEKCS